MELYITGTLTVEAQKEDLSQRCVILLRQIVEFEYRWRM